MSSPRPTVVWFKRDLRITDHAPLAQAARAGPVLPLYIVEPDYWRLPDTSARHWAFLSGAVRDLAAALDGIGAPLTIRKGEAVPVLAALRDLIGPFRLAAHMETGNAWTYARDEAVRAWCRETGTAFDEAMQFGVWRGRDPRADGWAGLWDRMMSEPIVPAPDRIDALSIPGDPLPDATGLGLENDGLETLQPPGRAAALEMLDTFLHDRGEQYQTDMSSPVTGETGCSRLSVHLMAGSISMREVYQATRSRQEALASLPPSARGDWPKALRAFVGRLHWHCHFMQKLETEPELEWLPMARSYHGLRTTGAHPDRLAAFEAGRTGYPFVDACLRSLRATGWLNFRMRAMLMSFTSYNLWLPWQESGLVLARLFTDYEPGIHWSQSQMQAGETGINAVRIYSPVKQGHDQDPTGAFTRHWVPELTHLDGRALQEPWTADPPPADYPAPIVDYAASVREAKSRIYGHRRKPEVGAEADEVFARHGSRKRPGRRTG